MTTEVGREYRSELFRKLAAKHEAVGEARGEGRAVLTVLDARGVRGPPGSARADPGLHRHGAARCLAPPCCRRERLLTT